MSSYVFIDSRVQDVDSLLAGLTSDIQVIILDPTQDGLAKIAQALKGVTDLDAIHIFSHGSEGTLYLGATVVTSDTFSRYTSELASIGAALTNTGDILVYGCKVANGVTGQTFIENLARYTGADIAASTDTTGSATLGGDWALEASVGSIQSDLVITATAQESYEFALKNVNIDVGSTAAPQVAAATKDLPYKLVWTRESNGYASCTFYDHGEAVLSSADSDYASAKFAWDDATPWNAGTYLASKKTPDFHNSGAPAWQLSPNPAGRTDILLHWGNYPDNSHGCLVAPSAFLNNINDILTLANRTNFQVEVVNDFPLGISLDASSTTVREGVVAELHVSLNRVVSKDIWVKVELDDKIVGPGFAKLDDVLLLDDDLRELDTVNDENLKERFEGLYVRIKEGTTEAIVKLN